MNFDYNKQLEISLGGTKDAVRKADEALDKLTFTDNEGKDRLPYGKGFAPGISRNGRNSKL